MNERRAAKLPKVHSSYSTFKSEYPIYSHDGIILAIEKIAARGNAYR